MLLTLNLKIIFDNFQKRFSFVNWKATVAYERIMANNAFSVLMEAAHTSIKRTNTSNTMFSPSPRATKRRKTSSSSGIVSREETFVLRLLVESKSWNWDWNVTSQSQPVKQKQQLLAPLPSSEPKVTSDNLPADLKHDPPINENTTEQEVTHFRICTPVRTFQTFHGSSVPSFTKASCTSVLPHPDVQVRSDDKATFSSAVWEDFTTCENAWQSEARYTDPTDGQYNFFCYVNALQEVLY